MALDHSHDALHYGPLRQARNLTKEPKFAYCASLAIAALYTPDGGVRGGSRAAACAPKRSSTRCWTRWHLLAAVCRSRLSWAMSSSRRLMRLAGMSSASSKAVMGLGSCGAELRHGQAFTICQQGCLSHDCKTLSVIASQRRIRPASYNQARACPDTSTEMPRIHD